MKEPLVDAHAHFLWDGCGRTDWREVNASRLRAGECTKSARDAADSRLWRLR